MCVCQRLAVAFLLLAAVVNGQACGDYGYTEGGSPPGPSQWGTICTSFALCGSGVQQSPIDIRESMVMRDAYYTTPLVFDYSNIEMKDMVVNNVGHTVRIDIASTVTPQLLSGGSLNGTYRLLQFHFHTGSEHTVDGELFEFELHFVHSNTQGGLAVVGILFKKGPESEFLKQWQNVLTSIPLKGNTTRLNDTLLNAFPSDKETSWWSYDGSLTTPPCSEGVKWTVLKTPMTASQEQIEAFGSLVHHNDRRPVQPLGTRLLKQFGPHEEHSDLALRVGLGVGLGLGIPVVIGVILLVCLIRKKSKDSKDKEATASKSAKSGKGSKKGKKGGKKGKKGGKKGKKGKKKGRKDEEDASSAEESGTSAGSSLSEASSS